MRHEPTTEHEQPSRESLLAQYQFPVGPEPEVPRRAPAFTGEKRDLDWQEPPSQFSMGHMMAIVVAVCLLMAPAQAMSTAAYAGFMGLVTLAFVGIMSMLGLRGSLVWAVFLALLLVYAAASLMAALH